LIDCAGTSGKTSAPFIIILIPLVSAFTGGKIENTKTTNNKTHIDFLILIIFSSKLP
jgi:hypothetical protein